MPTRRRSEPEEPYRLPRLKKDPEEVERLIEERISAGRALPILSPAAILTNSFDSVENDVENWSSFNWTLLGKLFDTREIAEGYTYASMYNPGTRYESPILKLQRLQASVNDRISFLQGVIQKLPLYELAPPEDLAPVPLPRSSPAPARGSVVNVYGGNIGALNTGRVSGNVQGSVSATTFRDAIQAMSKAIADDPSLSPETRADALEKIDYASESANQGSAHRRLAVLRAVVTSLPDTLAISSRALKAWDRYGPIIKAHLGI